MEQNTNVIKFKKSYVRNNGSLIKQRQTSLSPPQFQSSSTVPRSIPLQDTFNQMKISNYATRQPTTPHDYTNHSYTFPNLYQVNHSFSNLSTNPQNVFRLPIINEEVKHQFPKILINHERKKKYEEQKFSVNKASVNPCGNRSSTATRKVGDLIYKISHSF